MKTYSDKEIREACELAMFKRLVTELYPSGIVSIVSDTWDLWTVVTDYLPRLKDDILNRTPNALGLAKVVIRPDSGNPVDIICGTVSAYPTIENDDDWYNYIYKAKESKQNIIVKYQNCYWKIKGKYIQQLREEYGENSFNYSFEDLSSDRCGEAIETIEIAENHPEAKGAIELLWDTFGGTINDKGYKVLNERIGLIYGDSITLERQQQILSRLEAKGFASSNVVFGIGSYTYQYSTRDTFGFAMKATYGEVEGDGREIFKDPVTDSGVKKSARGLLRVDKKMDAGTFVLSDQVSEEEENGGELITVFKNSELINEVTLAEIRNRLH